MKRINLRPWLLDPKDPHYRRYINRGNKEKYLTIVKSSGILKRVKKLKRKDGKMALDKKQNNKENVAKSAAWLIEASFRAYVGYVLLTNFDQLVAIVAGVYALFTAIIIVVSHFMRAYK